MPNLGDRIKGKVNEERQARLVLPGGVWAAQSIRGGFDGPENIVHKQVAGVDLHTATKLYLRGFYDYTGLEIPAPQGSRWFNEVNQSTYIRRVPVCADPASGELTASWYAVVWRRQLVFPYMLSASSGKQYVNNFKKMGVTWKRGQMLIYSTFMIRLCLPLQNRQIHLVCLNWVGLTDSSRDLLVLSWTCGGQVLFINQAR